MNLIIKIFIIALVNININIKNKINFENKLVRYIKFNKKNIAFKSKEQKLIFFLNYVKDIKEKKLEIYDELIDNPKVSFISTIFNQEKFLSTFISSIQNQNLKEYELIFIDDFSIDNSEQLILNIKKLDNRIKLIKNKKNMGTLYSRYIGQTFAKSKYSIFFDCDDIILKNGIFKSYNHIIKYKLDIVQFLTIWQEKNSITIKTNIYKYKKIIYQPFLSYIYYYDYKNHKGCESNFALWDKLIKTEIMNKAFKYIGHIYLKKKIIIHNDLIILFSLFQMANSYQFINEIGYYYIRNNKNSASNSWNEKNKKNEIISSLFTNIEFLYEKTNNTYLDKYFCIFKIQHYFRIYNQLFKNLNDRQFYYIKKIIDKIINLNYISINDRLNLTLIEILILNKKGN